MSTKTTAPALGRRERKKRETREALHRAALAAILERGLAGVTVEEIADEADVSVRTFFNYFASKEEAVLGVDPGLPAELRAAVLARPDGEEPLASLRAVLVETAQRMSADPEAWGRRLQAVRNHPELLTAHLAAWSAVERSLVEAVALRTGTDAERDLYPGLVVAAAVGANRVAALHWKGSRSRGGQASLSALVGQALDVLARGLRPPPDSAPATSPSTTTP